MLVLIRVGVPGNQRPVFRGKEDAASKPSLYMASVKENVKPGSEVITVVATDPDGQDSLLEYFIAGGAKDNFLIDRKLGKIKVSPYAHLDYEEGSHYDIVVHAVDAGTPIRETATATVVVEILDVNNKPPVFPNNDLSIYTHYLSEQTEIGESVMNVTAFDPDADAAIKYSIIEPIRATDRTGLPLKSNTVYKDWFKINSSTGEISVAQPLDHHAAAVVIFTVQAKDLNAKENIDLQTAKVEVTIYIQAYSDSNPVFTLHGWSGKNNIVKLKIPEEQPVGTVLFRLTAKDPTNNKLIKRYEKLKHETKRESEDFFNIAEQTGDIILNKKLDFEKLQQRVLSFQVRAFADDGVRTSVANVVVEVQNINDHSPKFKQESYDVKILESAQFPQMVLSVHASDEDGDDNTTGYGTVYYSLSGENMNLFTIDAATGVIQVAKNVQLDREKQPTLKFQVIAADTPQGGANQRKSTVMVTVEVLDVNDNAPQFNKNLYSAVVPENVAVGTHVVTVMSVDPDEGLGGEVSFDFSNEGEASGLFSINHSTGNVSTRQALTGKGRTEPYQLMVRAQDKGNPPLSSDVPLIIHIGDVFSNDGVPVFIRPKIDEQAYISENSSIGSPVFQVKAADPDDPNTPNGKILYKFLNDRTDTLAFSIDSHSGLITSSQLLDREMKDKYALVVLAQDQGNPPQQTTRMLLVHITDIDDHKPIFRRKLDDEPLMFSIPEELDVGTEVGKVEAVDEDLGDNGNIDYIITFGNEDGLFSIKRTDDNKGVISVARRVDRETAAEHMLTVKCFKLFSPPPSYRKQYSKQDPSEQQVKIIVQDIDDNKPEFIKENITVGVRLNVPVDTTLLTLEVVDKDSSALPVSYKLVNTTFFSLSPSVIDTVLVPTNNSIVFQLDEQTGELRTAGSMLSFVDGYFEMKVTANNSDQPGREANTTVKIFVLRDRDLLKFVFGKPPSDVRRLLPDFQREVEKALLLPVSVNIYDTQFYAKEDGSLDFSSTSSCFQLVGKESYDLNELQYLLQDPDNTELDNVYAKYGVQGVQRCIPLIAKAEASWIQLWVLAVACFIGLSAFISGLSVCCLYSRYKRQSRRSLLHEAPPGPLSSIGYLSGAGSGPTVVLTAPPLTENPHMYEWVHDGTVLPSGHDNMSYQSFPVR
ncbi:cadherin EGF LAG seven-pass G-type receptor 3 isoform X2 [Bacillus rossius redtenbacheri]|uniref:cadherin EGF LAG seven-pass G-type receptor 3 isoform X2 n=1 Tax=Bacillus rossius redtenbacheri TaxID=93214 RepID=UPI002FDE321A